MSKVELKKELFSVRVPFRPELFLRLVNLSAWNLDREGGRGGEERMEGCGSSISQ